MSSDSPADVRRATIRTTHHAADLVAGALAPDDTESTAVTAADDTVVCRIERPTTGGLRSTVDDYLVNLRVATRVVDRASEHTDTTDAQPTDTQPTSTAHTTTQTDHTDTT
jgi:hypothetical protein